jgi:ATP-dependent Clp protease ATP-binding subunit ClpB
LKRTIQRKLLDPLALDILQGTFADGDTIRVEAAGDDLAFSKGAPQQFDS